MKKRVLSFMLALVLILTFGLVTTNPVSADEEDEIFIRVKGEISFESGGWDAVAKAKVTIDSVSGEFIAVFNFGKPVYNPFIEQWIKGIYGEAELESWDIDGSTIELGIGPCPVYVLPSGDLWAVEPNSAEIDITGTISRNKVTLEFGPSYTDMIGTIKMY